jgi:hypothetical protein
MSGLFSVIGRSLRGLRLVEAFALLMLLVMVLGNYLAKASAGRERGDITAVESQINDEQRSLRLLDAEVAHLEQPARMERLSAIAGLGPTGVKHEGTLDQLPEIARAGALPDKGMHPAAPAASTSSGLEAAAPKAVVVASAPTKGGGPQ